MKRRLFVALFFLTLSGCGYLIHIPRGENPRPITQTQETQVEYLPIHTGQTLPLADRDPRPGEQP